MGQEFDALLRVSLTIILQKLGGGGSPVYTGFGLYQREHLGGGT